LLFVDVELRPAARIAPSSSLLPKPWIDLPRKASELRDAGTRSALLSYLVQERSLNPGAPLNADLFNTLAFSCGLDYQSSEASIHQLWLVDAWEPARRIQLKVRAGQAEFEDVVAARFPTFASSAEAEAGGQNDQSSRTSDRRVLKHVSVADLDEVQTAWASTDLLALDPFGFERECPDSPSVLIAACVGGKFEVRHHRCSDAAQSATTSLLEALQPFLERMKTERAP
jgi:hypothetical protein